MNSDQLDRLLTIELGPAFAGVFARDQLPTSLAVPSGLIVNLDPASKPGSHWVAFYFDVEGPGEYFDSLGKIPPGMTCMISWENTQKTQCHGQTYDCKALASASCGQYCAYFLCHRFWGVPMHRILSVFSGTNLPLNDCLVTDWVNERFDMETQCHPWPQVQSCIPYVP